MNDQMNLQDALVQIYEHGEVGGAAKLGRSDYETQKLQLQL